MQGPLDPGSAGPLRKRWLHGARTYADGGCSRFRRPLSPNVTLGGNKEQDQLS